MGRRASNSKFFAGSVTTQVASRKKPGSLVAQRPGATNPSVRPEGITVSSITEVRTTEKQLTRNIAAVVADLVQRNNQTPESFAELIGTPRVKVQRQLDGALPFRMTDLAAVHELGWAKPSHIIAAAERGELYPPATGSGSIPLATWGAPAWADDEPSFDLGCLYAERVAVHGGVTVTLAQTDQLEYDTESRTYSVVRQPATIHIASSFEGDVLSINDARALITGSSDDPQINALVEVLTAYDQAMRPGIRPDDMPV